MTKSKILFHRKFNTLRSFITITFFLTSAISLLCVGTFFYRKSASLLTATYKQNIISQLNQINKQAAEKIDMIDSMYPLFLSNSIIRENLEPTSSSRKHSIIDRRLEVERQLSYLLISTYPWDADFIDAVYIFGTDGYSYDVSLNKNKSLELENNLKILNTLTDTTSSLEIKTLPDNSQTLYFARSIRSMYTGDAIATMIINVNQESFKKSYSENTDENWIVYLFNKEMQVLDNAHMLQYPDLLKQLPAAKGFEEITLQDTSYFMASKEIEGNNILSVVGAPVDYVLSTLKTTLHTFLLIFLVIITVTLILTLFLSRAITVSIEKMIAHVRQISRGEKVPDLPNGLYSEFNELSEAFNMMLKKLDAYYFDNFQKQLLLKNAEIKALQAQMDPHFLFNVLDTIAWKAQMSDNEDIYQMIISLGELLRANTLSNEKDFIILKEELDYVKFYVYLQQMRFEDKFFVDIQVEPSLYNNLIPRFCIQPLVENAIVHGLEQKKGFGRLCVNIIRQETEMEIAVIDNGVGFAVTNVQDIKSSQKDSHTHIGLKNLDKRLSLLYGPDSHLTIKSIRNEYTAISFHIPLRTEE